MTSPAKLFYVTQIILQKWSCNQKFGNSSISMREVIITSILYKFDQKKHIFEGWSWFKFINLRLALIRSLKFYTSVAKGLKLKVRNVQIPTIAPFCPFILNRVEIQNYKCKKVQNKIKRLQHWLRYCWNA